MKSITRKDGGMYQCFAFGIDHNDIAIGSSQLDLGGKKNSIPYYYRSSKNFFITNVMTDLILF